MKIRLTKVLTMAFAAAVLGYMALSFQAPDEASAQSGIQLSKQSEASSTETVVRGKKGKGYIPPRPLRKQREAGSTDTPPPTDGDGNGGGNGGTDTPGGGDGGQSGASTAAATMPMMPSSGGEGGGCCG